MNATRSHVASTSPSRCELRNACAAVTELANQVADEQPAKRIESGCGLVEEHQLWLVEKRLRQSNTLQHPFAVSRNLPIRGIVQVHAQQQRVDPSFQRYPAQPVEPSVEAQQLAARQVIVKAEMLRKEPDPGADRTVANRRTEQGAAPARGRHEREQHFQRSRLAGAVWSEEPEDFPALD